MKNKKTSERGVAVLFALGILGMMTVLALTFASVSMTNQTIAKNSTEQLGAKSLVDTVKDRMLAALSFSGYPSSTMVNSPLLLKNLYSKDFGPGVVTFDWLWKLGLTGLDIQSALYRTDEVCDYSSTANVPTWQYTFDTSKTPSPIIGRFAYVALAADLPVVNLNTILLKEDNTTNIAASKDRLGMSMGELDANFLYEAQTKQLEQSAGTFYQSFSQINANLLKSIADAQRRISDLSDLEIFIPGVAASANAAEIKRKKGVSKVISSAFTVGAVKYPEIFLLSNTDAAYRFDITQNGTLVNMAAADRNKLVEKIVGIKDSVLAKWGGTDSVSTQIKWLADFADTKAADEGYTAKDSVTASKHKAQQIAANLVDFFSAGTSPTSDSSNWFTTTPRYIGLKKTPYLCGVGAKFELCSTQTSTADSSDPVNYTHKLSFSANIAPHIEVCNMYELAANPELKIGMKGNISVKVKVDGQEATIVQAIDTSTSLQDANIGKDKGIYLTSFLPALESDSTAPLTMDVTTAQYGTYSITVEKVSFELNVVLEYNGNFVDFSEIKTDMVTADFIEGGTSQKASFTNDSGVATSHFFASAMEVSDPRHNLFPSTWDVFKKVSFKDTESVALLNAHALVPDLGTSAKADIADNPLYINSYGSAPFVRTFGETGAYIPENAITSPWELGAIHRGAPWQTLNLKAFNEGTPLAGGEYSAGDAGLLEQICLTNHTEVYGKIPLNEIWDKNSMIFSAMLRNTLHKAGIEKLLESATDKSYVDLAASEEAMKEGIPKFFKAKKEAPAGDYYFRYRAELAKLLVAGGEYGLPAAVSATNDSLQEEAFAKCVMLFDVEPTFLPRRVYVIGIAQTIKDVGGTVYKDWNGTGSFTSASSSSNLGKYNAGYRTGVSSGIDMTGASYPPGTIPATIGLYDNGADLILSEQKILVTLEREYTVFPYYYTSAADNNLPKWRIVGFEYVD